MTGEDLARALLSDPRALLARLQAEQARRSGSQSFAAFVRQAWTYVPQVEPLVWSWHMDAISLHLEEVARGGIERLAISVPPGHAKSVFGSVLWPAWIWTWWPKCQFIFGSYAHNYVIRDARRCREVISSEWYQTTYCRPGGWSLRQDYGSPENFSNTLGGVRFATSVGGAGAGLRAHVIGIDDPLNITEAYSKAARDEAVLWMSQTLSQRWVAGFPPRFALIMQRLHEEDPTDWMVKQGAEVLRLPSEFERDNRCITYHFVEKRNGHVERVRQELWRDPREEPGELLFPQLFPRERIDGDKKALTSFGFAAQHQQRPAPEGGGMFRVENWRFWTASDEVRQRLGYFSGMGRPRGCEDGPARSIDLEQLEEQVISVDGAGGSETSDGSFNAIHVWGKLGSRRLLLYRVHARMDFTDTVKSLLDVIKLFPEARRKLIEAKATGSAIISTLERAHGIIGCEPVNPGKLSKQQRAHAMQPYQSGSNVELPEGAPWLSEYVAEHAAFPAGAHDDDVDAQSQGLQGLERLKTSMELWQEIDELDDDFV